MVFTVALGLGLIALPHLIGASQAAVAHTDVPHALLHSFVVAATLTSLLFWALLSVCTSLAFRRMSRA